MSGLFCVALPSSAIDTSRYSDVVYHFNVAIPDGWIQVSGSELSELTPNFKGRIWNSLVIDEAFRRTERAPLEPPFILIAGIGGKIADMEIDQGSRVRFSSSIGFPGTTAASCRLSTPDPQDKALIGMGDPRVIVAFCEFDGIFFRLFMKRFFGMDNDAMLMLYTRESEWLSNYKTFERVIDSFEFDAGHGPPDWRAEVLFRVRSALVFGLIIGLLAWMYSVWKRRGTRSRNGDG